MTIQSIYAQLNCTDMQQSAKWFEVLFGREADASPMEGLKEWYHGDQAGFQLVLNSGDAGHGCLTLIVHELERERKRLREAGHKPGEIQTGDIASIFYLFDPDGNKVVLAE